MPLPSALTKANLDAGTDSPQSARGELASLVTSYNDLVTVLGTVVEASTGTTEGLVPLVSTGDVLPNTLMPVMVGATGVSAGTRGAVPASAGEADDDKFLQGDGTWQTPPTPAGTGGLIIQNLNTTQDEEGTTSVSADSWFTWSHASTNQFNQSITLKDSSSKVAIIIMVSIGGQYSSENSPLGAYRLKRDSTIISQGGTASSRTRIMGGCCGRGSTLYEKSGLTGAMYLDSPGGTGPYNYNLEFYDAGSGNRCNINDKNPTTSSSMILFEVD